MSQGRSTHNEGNMDHSREQQNLSDSESQAMDIFLAPVVYWNMYIYKVIVICINVGYNYEFFLVVVVQSPSCVWLFMTPWTAARQASVSLIISWSLHNFISMALMMPSSHFILWKPLSFCLQSFLIFPLGDSKECLSTSVKRLTGAEPQLAENFWVRPEESGTFHIDFVYHSHLSFLQSFNFHMKPHLLYWSMKLSILMLNVIPRVCLSVLISNFWSKTSYLWFLPAPYHLPL